MFYLLELREKIKKIYQEKETIVNTVFKFIVSFIVFYTISTNLNFCKFFSSSLVLLLLSLIGAFVPSAMLAFMATIVASLEVFYFNMPLGFVVIGVLLVLYCLFIRFTPKLGIAVLAVPIAFALKVPCLIPIVLGLVATPVASIAVGCGTIVYYLFDAVKNVAGIIGNTTEEGNQVYVYLVKQFKDNVAMIYTIIVFVLITIIVYVVRTREVNYAPEVAIVTGGIVNLLAFLIADLTRDIEIPMNIFTLIFGTIGACLIAYIIQNFKCALDYTTVEKVQFEDDDYYYYVKAIPKIKVATQQNDIKKIAVQKPISVKNNEEFQEEGLFTDKSWDDKVLDEDNSDDNLDGTVNEEKIKEHEEEIQREIKKDLEKTLENDVEEINL